MIGVHSDRVESFGPPCLATPSQTHDSAWRKWGAVEQTTALSCAEHAEGGAWVLRSLSVATTVGREPTMLFCDAFTRLLALIKTNNSFNPGQLCLLVAHSSRLAFRPGKSVTARASCHRQSDKHPGQVPLPSCFIRIPISLDGTTAFKRTQRRHVSNRTVTQQPHRDGHLPISDLPISDPPISDLPISDRGSPRRDTRSFPSQLGETRRS